MIKIQNLTFNYGATAVLKGINHQFHENKYHTILGPSGNGKSTLLKLVAGYLQSTSGTITKSENYGYVLQDGGLFNHLDAKTNIGIQGIHLGWSSKQLSSRIDELCELTRFPQNLIGKFPTALSGGQRQRLALMRSLFLDPKILLFDEFLSGIDPLLKYQLMKDLIHIIRNLQKTVLHVTHDLVEASILSDEIVLMNNGTIDLACDKKSFFSNPPTEFSQKYIQSQRVEL